MTVSPPPASPAPLVEPSPFALALQARLVEKERALEEMATVIRNAAYDRYPFVTIGRALHSIYYVQRLMRTQREFLDWAKEKLRYSKSTTYEFIVSYKVFQEIESSGVSPPKYQSHCQLLSKIVTPELVDAWRAILRACPDSGVTTSFLEEFISQMPAHCLVKVKSKRKRSSLGPEGMDDGQLPLPPPQSLLLMPPASQMEETVEQRPSSSMFLDEGNGTASASSASPTSGANSAAPTPRLSPLLGDYVPPSEPRPIPMYTSLRDRDLGSATTKYSFHNSCKVLFERAKTVLPGGEFDTLITTHNFELLSGDVWGNLSVFDSNSIQRVVATILQKWREGAFQQGLFLVPVDDFHSHWVRQMLKFPFCKLNQNFMRDNSNWFVFYIGPDATLFALVFESFGIIPGLNSWTYTHAEVAGSAGAGTDAATPQATANPSGAAEEGGAEGLYHPPTCSGHLSPPATQRPSGTTSVRDEGEIVIVKREGEEPTTFVPPRPVSLVVPVVTEREAYVPKDPVAGSNPGAGDVSSKSAEGAAAGRPPLTPTPEEDEEEVPESKGESKDNEECQDKSNDESEAPTSPPAATAPATSKTVTAGPTAATTTGAPGTRPPTGTAMGEAASVLLCLKQFK